MSGSRVRRGRITSKALAGIVLVGIAAGALAFGLVREARQTAPPRGDSEPTPAAEEQPDAVVVYYFHGDARCPTCLSIEANTARVVQSRFEDEIGFGMLRFEIVNFDQPEHRHFREDFGLAFGSVVVQGPGPEAKWENLSDVWKLIHEDPAMFERYIVEHVRSMLEAAG